MRSLGVGSASSRRTMVAILFAGFAFTAVSVQAQDPPAPASAPEQAAAPAPAPAPPAEDPFKFTTEAGLIIFYVKPEQTAAFENVWGSIRGRLAASDQADLQALGQSIEVYRASGDPTPQGVTYFFVADPASRTYSYSPSPFLLFEAGLFEDAEARTLFEQLNAALNGINPLGINRAAAAIAPPPAPPAAPAAPEAPAAPAAE